MSGNELREKDLTVSRQKSHFLLHSFEQFQQTAVLQVTIVPSTKLPYTQGNIFLQHNVGIAQ